jgi:hypothetical protein
MDDEKIIFKKEYHGFEDTYDFDRDMAEALDPKFNPKATSLLGEFSGILTVTVSYREE